MAAAKDVTNINAFAVCKGRLCVVKSTAGAPSAKQIAALFDDHIAVFQRFLKGPFNQKKPITIRVFAQPSEYRAYLTAHGQPETVRSACYMPVLQESLITLEGDDHLRHLSMEIAKHEVTHHLIHFYTGSDWLPVWFDEGIACFFQYWDARQSTAENLGAQLERAASGDFGYMPRLVKETFATPAFPTPATLFALGYTEFHVSDTARESLHYSASWALVNFLITSPRGNRVLDYICTEFRKNPGPDQPTLDRVMSPTSLAALQTAWFTDITERIIPAVK